MGKGKILFVTTWYPVNVFRWLSTAFEDYGYEVIRVGKTYFDHYGIEWERELLPKVAQELDVDAPLDLPQLVSQYEPDILIFGDWVSCPIDNVEETKRIRNKIPVVLIEHEGWPNNFERMNLINPTLKYTAMPYGIVGHPCNAFEMGYRYLPGACYPRYHGKVNESFGSRDLDCVLFAGMYNPRPEICRELIDLGINIRYGQVNITGYKEMHNRALCTWEFGGGQEYVKWRIFEAMSMGCLVLSDRFSLMDRLGFTPDTHYIEYKPVPLGDGRTGPKAEDLKEKILIIKEHPEIWEDITQNAFSQVRRYHTYKRRVEQIINDIEAF